MKSAMISLRHRLSHDPDADPLIWPIHGELACSQRPLRDHPEYGESNPLPVEAFPLIDSWIKRIVSSGIKSVICLLTPDQLRRYDIVYGLRGLLGAYRDTGLTVVHIAVFDSAHPESTDGCEVLGQETFDKAYRAFTELPKPVLLHCSAGIDRSSPVAADIVLRTKKQLLWAPRPRSFGIT